MAEKSKIAVIGFKPKTGRTIAVVLSGTLSSPEIIRRVEVSLTDRRLHATFQPYHAVMELPWNESQQKVKPAVQAIERVAAKALTALVHEVRQAGLKVVAVGIAGPADRDLAKIGNYHIRAHAAEGLLFRQVLESAAVSNRIRHHTFIERTLISTAGAELRWPTTKTNKILADLGRVVGPPWRAEQRTAALAALIALGRS